MSEVERFHPGETVAFRHPGYGLGWMFGAVVCDHSEGLGVAYLAGVGDNFPARFFVTVPRNLVKVVTPDRDWVDEMNREHDVMFAMLQEVYEVSDQELRQEIDRRCAFKGMKKSAIPELETAEDIAAVMERRRQLVEEARREAEQFTKTIKGISEKMV